jgi:hypothetical protein
MLANGYAREFAEQSFNQIPASASTAPRSRGFVRTARVHLKLAETAAPPLSVRIIE